MHLKSLVLKGFKSFADRSVMSFEPGITVIVGPNGSGKSNVSDSVLWVLGERNARNLRGQAMEDVIFSGSTARKASGMAEVDLVLDNTDNTLPVEFSEVVLSRRMYRNGESEYLINGTQARRMDVLDILHDTGLGTGTHSIISQGHLSSILQSKPEDRRALIEEAAGVLKHKQRKEKSQRKLALMDEHLTRANDIVREVERQVKPLERKAKRALAYQDASAQLATLDLDLAVDDLRELQARWDVVCRQEAEAESAAATLREQIRECEDEASQLQDKLQASTADAGETATRYRRAQAAVDKLDSNVLLFHEKRRAANDYVAEMRISLENDSRTVEAAQAQRLAARENLDAAEAAAIDAARTQREAQERADEARTRQREIQSQIDRLSHERRDATADLEEARARLARTQEVVATNRAQGQMIETHVADLEQRLESAKQADEQAGEQAQEASRSLDAALAEEALLREATGVAMRERDAARAAHESTREERAVLAARVKSLEELRRARQERNPLLAWVLDHSDELASSFLPLIEAISAPAHLEAVVEELLGEDVQALIVEDEQAAMAIASRLARVDASGAVTLLSRAQAPAEPEAPAGAKRLVDRISCSDAAKDAVWSLLGDVFLFDDLKAAGDFAKAHPRSCCATESGFIVWSNGKLRCRRRRGDETSQLGDQRELDEAKARLAVAIEAEERAQAQSRDREEALRKAQAAGLELSQRVAQLRGQVQASKREADRASKALAALQGERGQLESRRRKTAEALAKAEPDATALAAKVDDIGELMVRLKDELDARRSELAPQRALADKASADLAEAKLQSATCSERTAYAKRMLQACERDIANACQQVERARVGMARKSAALTRIDPMIEVFTTLSLEARKRADVLEAQAAQTQGVSQSLHEQINAVRAKTLEAHESYDAASRRLADVRVEKSRIEMQVEAAISTIVDGCSTPLETAVELPKLQNRHEVEAQAEKLRRRIANMGTINPDAAAEYEALKQRYDYLSSQLEDMRSARRSLDKIVAVIDARMKDDFANTFDVVNANFKSVFAELFPGGSGSLSLTDPQDMENTGVEVSAQPPGKRILKMSLMSGGEKSLTALALLFAVYKTRATPFYILDEVEAALDDTNLRRLVGYLDSMRHDSQFIIITHQRRTMEMADVLYGISMQSDGVTKVMSQRLDKALQYAEG